MLVRLFFFLQNSLRQAFSKYLYSFISELIVSRLLSRELLSSASWISPCCRQLEHIVYSDRAQHAGWYIFYTTDLPMKILGVAGAEAFGLQVEVAEMEEVLVQ